MVIGYKVYLTDIVHLLFFTIVNPRDGVQGFF